MRLFLFILTAVVALGAQPSMKTVQIVTTNTSEASAYFPISNGTNWVAGYIDGATFDPDTKILTVPGGGGGGSGTVTSITLTQPAAGLTISSSGVAITTSGTRTFALANDLAALEGLSGTGYPQRTSTDTWSISSTIPWSSVASTPTTLSGYGITDAQPLDSDLTTYAGITPSANVQTLLGAANYAAFKTSLSLNNVENTALSTWAGSSSITTLGTIGTGTWQGSVIAPAYLGTGTSITTKYLRGDGTWQTISGGGDALTSSSLDQFADVTQTAGQTLAITSSTTLNGGTHSGTNTGDQTSVTGNSGTVTFADAGGDTTTFVALGTAATGSLSPATDAGLTYNATTDALTATTFSGALSGNATTATALQTTRTIGGSNFDGSANVTSFPSPGAIGGSTPAAGTFTTLTATTSVVPSANDGAALGSTTAQFSDLFLAEGGVINFDNGDATITQTGNDITVAGITTLGVGTSTAVTLGTIETGAASDTTIARGAAGRITVEGVNVPTISSTDTFTNKTIDADDNDLVDMPVVITVACSDETTAITTGTAKRTFRAPFAFTLTGVRASVGTAPTGATLTVDINEEGTTVLSTKLTIDVSEETSTTAATAAVISDSAIADDAEITIDFDQVGSTVAGAGVKVTLIGKRTL